MEMLPWCPILLMTHICKQSDNLIMYLKYVVSYQGVTSRISFLRLCMGPETIMRVQAG